LSVGLKKKGAPDNGKVRNLLAWTCTKDAITIAVMNSAGKVVMESHRNEGGWTILQFIQGLRGDVLSRLKKELGTWLYDLLKAACDQSGAVRCHPRKSALLKDGSKGDKIDARKLAELLRGGYVKPVYTERMASER